MVVVVVAGMVEGVDFVTFAIVVDVVGVVDVVEVVVGAATVVVVMATLAAAAVVDVVEAGSAVVVVVDSATALLEEAGTVATVEGASGDEVAMATTGPARSPVTTSPAAVMVAARRKEKVICNPPEIKRNSQPVSLAYVRSYSVTVTTQGGQ